MRMTMETRLCAAAISGVLLLAIAPKLGAETKASDAATRVEYSTFQDPPGQYGGIRWVTLDLSKVTAESLATSIDKAASNHSAGAFELGPTKGPTTGLSEAYLAASKRKPDATGVPYLSEEYFRLYRMAIEKGNQLGFPLSMLYDEWNYPTGMVGGQFYSKYPELGAKSLEMVEKDVTGPSKLSLPVPEGLFMGAVLMNLDTHERVVLNSARTKDGAVECAVPKGNWKAMAFYLDSTFRPNSQKGGFVDYLDANAVDKFIAMSYGAYYEHLKEFFGHPIKMSFYDEPSMHLSHGRMWTPDFNKGFEEKYGYSPLKYYPALWYDIGPETAAARNALYGFHAELYAYNFIGRLAAWCEAHGIQLTGHQDQEEARNPVAIHGDLMKVFEKQQAPAIDDIYFTGRSNVSYKVVTSSSFNWDKPVTVAETYAAYRNLTRTSAYQTAMDQYAMGVNMQVNGPPASMGAEMGAYIRRLSYMLQHGRHVADVAVLYPIAALQAAYTFATPTGSNRGGGDQPTFLYALEGGLIPPEIDYMDLGEMLYRGLRVDYTYLHPDVLTARCTVEGSKLVLNNKENREEFKILIVPGGDTLSVNVAHKILGFYQGGGTVIATHKLPTHSSEFGQDRELQKVIGEIFGMPVDEPMTAQVGARIEDYKNYFFQRNDAGGRSYFIPQPDPALMEAVLKEADPVKDVEFQEPAVWPVKMGTAYDGALTYIHKVKDGRDIYFFANSTEKPVETRVVLRSNRKIALWNPHTGEQSTVESTQAKGKDDAETTSFRLSLQPVSSAFFVSER